jgi:hypothetical protein
LLDQMDIADAVGALGETIAEEEEACHEDDCSRNENRAHLVGYALFT